jgi:hypothetical protein
MNSPIREVRVEDWSMGLIAGEWRHPDGDGYVPEPGWGEAPDDLAGDVWVEGPRGVRATITWEKGDPTPMERMLPSRGRGDLGAFTVWTDVPPVTRRDTESFLRQLLPALRALTALSVSR